MKFDMSKVLFDDKICQISGVCSFVRHIEQNQKNNDKQKKSNLAEFTFKPQINNSLKTDLSDREQKFLDHIFENKEICDCWVKLYNKKLYNVQELKNGKAIVKIKNDYPDSDPEQDFNKNKTRNIEMYLNHMFPDKMICRYSTLPINSCMGNITIEQLSELCQKKNVKLDFDFQFYAIIKVNTKSRSQNIEIRIKLNKINIAQVSDKTYDLIKKSNLTEHDKKGYLFRQQHATKKSKIAKNISNILEKYY